VTAIAEALSSSGATGKIAVIGNAKIATALAAKHEIVPVALSARRAKQHPEAVTDVSVLDPRSLGGLVALGIADDDAWHAKLEAWSQVVRDGGAIVLVDRGRAAEVSRRALCGGLTELEQRRAGRVVVTSGLVTHLARAFPATPRGARPQPPAT
jgi:hypothetical protein